MAARGPSLDPATLPAQFPGPVIMSPSRLKKRILYLAGFIEFVLALVWLYVLHILLGARQPLPPHYFLSLAVVGILIVISFLASGLIVISTFRNFPRLVLDREAMEVHPLWLRISCTRWSEIARFRRHGPVVVIEAGRSRYRWWDGLWRAQVWIDTCGLGPEKLCRMMNAWRERALEQTIQRQR